MAQAHLQSAPSTCACIMSLTQEMNVAYTVVKEKLGLDTVLELVIHTL